MRQALEKLQTEFKEYGLPEGLFMRLFSSFFAVSAVQNVLARVRGISPVENWQNFTAEFQPLPKLIWTAVVFLWISLVFRIFSKKLRRIDNSLLIISAAAFSLTSVWHSGNFYACAAAGAVAAVFTACSFNDINRKEPKAPVSDDRARGDMPEKAVVFAAAAAVFIFIASTTVAVHKCFGTSCFDMGIFVQTFHSLKEHLNAVITCERDRVMSHFQVHGSFIFYLLTPIYALFPRGETLLVIQALFASAGVIPLYMISKRHGFKGLPLVCTCLIYTFCAGIVLPCYFQFHENALLPTLLMWLLYAADSEKIPLFYIMSVLVCAVKEDAPLYVICVALYFAATWTRLKKKHGVIAAMAAGLYFVVIMKWLTGHGDGDYMTATRLGILMTDHGSGIWGVIKNAIVDPGYLMSLLLSQNTLLFFVETMLPLMFLPFLTKKLHRYLLMIPYLIMNLIIGAGYGYAADIGFQYIFGPSCLLIYLSVVNASEITKNQKNTLMAAAAAMSVIFTVSMASPKLSYIKQYRDAKSYYLSADRCITSVPEEGSALVNAFFLPHAANRDEVYELDEGCFEMSVTGEVIGMPGLDGYDFCIFSTQDPLTEKAMPYLNGAGWTKYAESEGGFVEVYVRPGWAPQA